MPTLPVNDLEDTAEDFTDAHWKEAVEARHPGGFDHFSGNGDGEATLVSRSIPNERLRGALRFAVGYQSVSGSTGSFRLWRRLPLRHPRWQELVCTNASCRPFAPPNRTSTDPAPSTKLKRYVAGAPNIPTFSGYADYSLAEVSFRFEGVDYELQNDDALIDYDPGAGYTIRPEWQRMTSFDSTPRVEQLSLEGFQLVYAEGTGCPDPPYSNPQGKSFPAPFAQLLVKTDVNFTTYRLPENFLFTSGTLLPRNVLAGLGKVNRYDWNGYKAGTLLFMVAKLERKRWTLKTASENRWLWTMTCGFSYFNPTKGYTGTTPAQITTRLGHNNMPWRGQLVSGDLNAGKWFAATRTGNINDAGLLETFDIGQLWNPVGNPLVL